VVECPKTKKKETSMPRKHISNRGFRVRSYSFLPKVVCEGGKHRFVGNMFGIGKPRIDQEKTNETRERIQPMMGKGAGKGSIRIIERRYDSFAVCLCGQQRDPRGYFWKVESREIVAS
jgi:hypothetical protein